jgi:HPt (histidine-containing phosphotransfer) domain-containing protein
MPYDLEASLARLGGDSELFRKLIQFFLEDGPPLLTQISSGISTGNAAQVERAGHSIKGLAANFGAKDAVDAALVLEECGRAADLAGAEAAFPELDAQFDRLRRALMAYLDASRA